jgi:hypothetical protein
MQSEVLGEWDVILQEGHVESRDAKERWEYLDCIEERGNVEADNVQVMLGWVQSRTRRYGKEK